jgi:hypothetical protein
MAACFCLVMGYCAVQVYRDYFLMRSFCSAVDLCITDTGTDISIARPSTNTSTSTETSTESTSRVRIASSKTVQIKNP